MKIKREYLIVGLIVLGFFILVIACGNKPNNCEAGEIEDATEWIYDEGNARCVRQVKYCGLDWQTEYSNLDNCSGNYPRNTGLVDENGGLD